MIEAKVIADSMNEAGDRCTTVEVTYPRFVHAELMTHRVFSRNSASSRAVPVIKFLDQLKEDPVRPLVWASEKKGMQGGPPLEGIELQKAQDFWERMVYMTIAEIEAYLQECEPDTYRLHKSLINRWMEPALYHKVIITGTDWGGFFKQRSTRYTPLAMPEIARAADLVLACIEGSDPDKLVEGDHHLPYIHAQDQLDAEVQGFTTLALMKVSAARCARVSYLTHDGKRDLSEDMMLYNRLVGASPMHASPLEHVAWAYPNNARELLFPVNRATLGLSNGPGQQSHLMLEGRFSRIGNLKGFLQLRAVLEADRSI